MRLSRNTDRLAQHKRFLPVTVNRLPVGKQWVDRPMVPYTGNTDDGGVTIEPEEIGSNLPNIEWADNADDLKRCALDRATGALR